MADDARRARRRIPAHARRARGHAGMVALKAVAASVAVLLASSASVAAIAAWDVGRSAQHGVVLQHFGGTPARSEAPTIAPIDGAVNILLVGSDTRTGQTGMDDPQGLEDSSGVGNNDVNLMLHLSADHSNATVVSFPRDLVLPFPTCQDDKGNSYPAESAAQLNTALPRGGLSCAVRVIEKLTGQQMDYAALVHFDGVAAMSNAIGGVTVCLASPVKDSRTSPPLDLPAGENTLVGGEAVSFLRTRHAIGDSSDLGRISNQQLFLSALVRKVKSGGVLGNPLKLYPLAKVAVANVTPSANLTATTLVQVALAMRSIPLSDIVFARYPVTDDPYNVNRVVPLQAAAQQFNDALASDSPLVITGGTGPGSENAPSTPTSPVTTAPPSTSAPGSAETSTPAPTSVQLPDSATGQSAADQTCTRGN